MERRFRICFNGMTRIDFSRILCKIKKKKREREKS